MGADIRTCGGTGIDILANQFGRIQISTRGGINLQHRTSAGDPGRSPGRDVQLQRIGVQSADPGPDPAIEVQLVQTRRGHFHHDIQRPAAREEAAVLVDLKPAIANLDLDILEIIRIPDQADRRRVTGHDVQLEPATSIDPVEGLDRNGLSVLGQNRPGQHHSGSQSRE